MFDRGHFDDMVDSTSQALGELFCGPHAGLFEFIRQEMEPKKEPSLIRVNHTDAGRSFYLINGRQPIREPDGSFLVTEEEYRGSKQIEGLWRVDRGSAA
jgi:hypothetical protein